VRAAVIAVLAAVATAQAGPPPPVLSLSQVRPLSPAIESSSAIALDAATGAELYAENADEIRPIASLTKIFVALVVRRHHLDLEAWTEITHVDAKAAEGGAGTRLLRGEAFRNLDLLHAMLMVSDNRVPTALARSIGLSPHELIDAMNELARKLGLDHTRFVDATGILGNQSTARELAIALRAVLRDPVLARIMHTRYARITSRSEAVTVDFRSTVQPLWEVSSIRGGKTGHTREAGYCFIVGARIAKRSVVMAFLGAPRSSARFSDFDQVSAWLAEPARRRH
jgi:D-alanyl-D-alanine carboxypeptidase